VGSLSPWDVLRHSGPDEADEFAGDRRHRDRRALAVSHEMAVMVMQTLLRPPGLGAARRGFALGARRQRPAERGTVAIVPQRPPRAPAARACSPLW
jgi:hypothetical protein